MTSTIGDILITFNDIDKALPTRSTSPWEAVARIKGVQVWTTKPDASWAGFPLTTYQDDGWQIWALGEFYGDPPDLPLALGRGADLNGHCLVIGYEIQADRWHALTNRFNSTHAYHAHNGGNAALGTFSPAVAGVAGVKNHNWDALAGFFTFGFFLGQDTFWREVQILPPAHHLVLDPAGKYAAHEPTWVWHHAPDPNLAYEAALEGFAERFEMVLKDQVHGKSVALPLSGGLDSRSTLVPLTKENGIAEQLVPFSYGYAENSVETRIARDLAEVRGLPIQSWTITPYLFEQLDQVLAATEGFQDLTLCRQAYVIDELASQASHVLAAHWGDVWLDDMGFLGAQAPLSDGELAHKLRAKFAKRGSAMLLELFKECLPADADSQLEEQIAAALKPLERIRDLDFKVKAWKTQTWSHRWTLASLRAYQAGLFPLLPFYDHRLVDFFMKLPSPWVAGRRLQVDYLKRYAPDLARVPWQSYDADLYHYQHFHTWHLPKRALKKLGRTLRGEKPVQRNWEVQFLNPQGREKLEDWLLSPGLKLHHFTGKTDLEAFLAGFYAQPDAAKGYATSMLLTFSAWLEAYGS